MALYVELSLAGLPVQAQQLINVYDNNNPVHFAVGEDANSGISLKIKP